MFLFVKFWDSKSLEIGKHSFLNFNCLAFLLSSLLVLWPKFSIYFATLNSGCDEARLSLLLLKSELPKRQRASIYTLSLWLWDFYVGSTYLNESISCRLRVFFSVWCFLTFFRLDSCFASSIDGSSAFIEIVHPLFLSCLEKWLSREKPQLCL